MKKYLFYKRGNNEVYLVIPRRRQPYFLIYTNKGQKLSLSLEAFCEINGIEEGEIIDRI
jgi:hypothetical protein